MCNISVNVGVLILTYKRLDYLKPLLEKYDSLEMLPNYIIVVDNGNNDETTYFLKKWENKKQPYEKKVIYLKENKGSSGGFNIGISECTKKGASWFVVQDDDAYPELNMIKVLDDTINNENLLGVAALTTKVLNHGKIDINHRRRIKKEMLRLKRIPVLQEEYKNNIFLLDEFSYVGVVMNKEITKKAGSTQEDLYMFYDDTEHSTRFRKFGKIICVPSAVIVHDKRPGTPPIWNYYYYYRNRGILLKKHYHGKYYYEYMLELILGYLLFFIPIKSLHHGSRKIIKDAFSDILKNKAGINRKYGNGS